MLLEVTGLTAGYGGHPAIQGVDLTVDEGEAVAVLGANGAGKTTLLSTVMGVLPAMAGTVRLRGEPLGGRGGGRAGRRARAGVRWVPEGRRVFPRLTARENIVTTCLFAGRSRQAEAVDESVELFPALAPLLDRAAEVLSGGEQQMVAISRALAGRPDLLLLDEPSLGLAPIVVGDVFRAVDILRTRGTTLLVVEQNAAVALRRTDRAYLLDQGQVVRSGASRDLLDDVTIRDAYLATT